MSRSFIGITALFAASYALQPAAAQVAKGITLVPEWKAEVLPLPVPGEVEFASAPTGFVVAPGISFVPQVFSELGFDSNPDKAFFDRRSSGFVRSGAGFNLSSVTEKMIANLSASGSMLNYFNEAAWDQPNRFAGDVRGLMTYSVQPGMTLSSGGFFTYDGQSSNRSQSGGASAEVGYHNDFFANFLRGNFLSVEYLREPGRDVPVSPLFLTSAFNYDRSEVIGGGLINNSARVSPYVEAGAARVDYTDQTNPAAINRSADDFYGKGGVRVRISQELAGDAGWRWNWRDTDDRHVSAYNSNFFDGSLTWRPSPFFFLTGFIERTIAEPSTAYAILSDIRSYNMKMTYLPVGGVAISLAGGTQVVTELGNGVHYHANFADARVSWDYNSRVQFYTTAQYQTYELDWRNLDYNCLRVMAGIRVVPDGEALLKGESVDHLFERLGTSRIPSEAQLNVSTGYSSFSLPDIKMATVVGGAFFDRAVRQMTNGDGDLGGVRTDLRLANFAEAATLDGGRLSLTVSGFYANYQNTTNSHCAYGLTTDCAIVNIVDFNRAQENNTGPFGDLNVVTDRNVNYYGLAIDTRLGAGAQASLKDGPGIPEYSPFKAGLAMRGLDETAKLTSIDPLVSDPVKYKETLNTHYYGGFVGIEEKKALGEGWALSLDATAGLYYTDTQFQGRYSGYTPTFGVGYVQESGSVTSNLDKGSFIGTLRIGLNQNIGWGSVGVFGQGEYLSYVPRIAYNNNDQAGGEPWGLVGTQVGTRVKSDDALNYTGGLNVSFKLN